MSASILFDAPGPRAKRRHRLLTIVGALLLLALVALVLRKMQSAGQLDSNLWKPFLTDRAVWRDYILLGLIGTLKAAAFSIVLAAVFGVVLGVGRLSQITPVRWLCGIIVEFFRSVPVLLMMIFAYFGIFTRTDLVSSANAPLAAVVTGLTLYNGSVIAELVRSGVNSLPSGQSEAGLSVGLTTAQTMRAIQLPQALTAMLPALVGQFVVVLKDSALGYQVLYAELLIWSKTLGSAFSNTVPAYIVAAVLFILLNYLLTLLAGRIERRINRRGKTAGGTITNAMPGAPLGTGTMPSTGIGGDNVQNIDPANTGR